MNEALIRRRALDFYLGLLFFGIGVFVFTEALRAYADPMLAETAFYSNPGVTLGFIAVMVMVMALSIAIMGWIGCRNPLKVAIEVMPDWVKRRETRKGFLVMASIAVYFFVLWPLLPYWLSTSVFLVGSMFLFKAGAWWKIALVTAVTVGVIILFFGVLALVPLPGL